MKEQAHTLSSVNAYLGASSFVFAVPKLRIALCSTQLSTHLKCLGAMHGSRIVCVNTVPIIKASITIAGLECLHAFKINLVRKNT